jgi:hypothetical protein
MSLTSYRAAPPRVKDFEFFRSVRTWTKRVCGFPASDPVRRPGADLLSRALRHSTMGAGGFHGRVRDGIGCWDPRYEHQVVQPDWPRTSSF